MAYTKVTGRNFYVYALYRDEYVTPFYIGKGCGQRWLVHEKEAYRFTCRKSRVIQSMWKAGRYEIPKRKLAEGLTDEEAKALEIKLIAEIGRAPNGPLVNHTAGGDGNSNPTLELRARMSAANVTTWADPVVREKRIAGMKAALGPPKPKPVKPTKSEVTKRRWQNPNYREARLSELTGRVQSEETKAKRAASIKKLFEREEVRVKHAEAIRLAVQVHGLAEKGRKRFEENPDQKAAFVAFARLPENAKKRGATLSANLNTPEGKTKRSAVMKANWARRKAAKAAAPLPLFDT